MRKLGETFECTIIAGGSDEELATAKSIARKLGIKYRTRYLSFYVPYGSRAEMNEALRDVGIEPYPL